MANTGPRLYKSVFKLVLKARALNLHVFRGITRLSKSKDAKVTHINVIAQATILLAIARESFFQKPGVDFDPRGSNLVSIDLVLCGECVVKCHFLNSKKS